jgi:uncharacterized protein (DUF433 family)
MSLAIDAIPVPLAADESGTVRVAGTRVTLDTIVTAYQQGETPEIIADQYPTVQLADVYAVINYYLRHRKEVESYLVRRQEEAAAMRRKLDVRFPHEEFRQRLLARRTDGGK